MLLPCNTVCIPLPITQRSGGEGPSHPQKTHPKQNQIKHDFFAVPFPTISSFLSPSLSPAKTVDASARHVDTRHFAEDTAQQAEASARGGGRAALQVPRASGCVPRMRINVPPYSLSLPRCSANPSSFKMATRSEHGQACSATRTAAAAAAAAADSAGPITFHYVDQAERRDDHRSRQPSGP